MAATEKQRSGPFIGGIVLAACALPGVLASTAHAEEAPTEGLVAFKLSHYEDSQVGAYGGITDSSLRAANDARRQSLGYATVSAASGGGGGGGGGSASGDPSYDVQRIQVTTPSMYALIPINRHWAAEGSATVDDVSGASPQYYTDMRSAPHFSDQRKAGDAKISYYAGRQSYALGVSHSGESDFWSNAVSAEARFSSDDQNTTWNLGLGSTHDRIDPTTHVVRNETRRTTEWQAGVTQALSAYDLVQATLTLSRASGYMNDPYKYADARPRQRNAEIMLLRWNHWLGASALKAGYRLYRDSYGIQAHTFDLALATPMGRSVTLTPGIRYYTQTAASFYANPNSGTYPAPAGTPQYFSADQRLAAYGAAAVNLKVALKLASSWTVDAKIEYYRQRTGWELSSQGGSPQLNPLNATIWQLGVSHAF